MADCIKIFRDAKSSSSSVGNGGVLATTADRRKIENGSEKATRILSS